MKKIALLTLCFLSSVFSFAQVSTDSLLRSGDSTYRIQDTTGAWGTEAHAPEMTVRNGNGTLGNIYSQTKCGLNYTEANVRTGKRFSPAGVNQPAPLAIAGIPAGAVIERAYLWAGGSGNGLAQTATVVNPASVSTNFPMTIVGSGPDKCWSYSGTYNYRADVTSIITGNGTYNISGIHTSPVTSGNDMDGIALFVIYSDPCASYQGTLYLNDGVAQVNGGNLIQTMTYPGACANSTAAQAFMYVGDLQIAATANMNGTAAPFTWAWWNYMNVNTSITAGQTSTAFNVNSSGDCFAMYVNGLYYQTTACVSTCGPSALGTATDPTDVTLCGPGGSTSFSITASGATVLNYQWYVNTGSGFTPLTNTSPYSGVNTNTLTISPTTLAMNGYQYQCLVDFCGADVTTAAATLNFSSPTAVCQNISVNLDASGMATILPAALDGGSSTTCGTLSFPAASTTSFNCSNVGANNVTLTVSNGMSTATCTSVVTVNDITPPAITCPANVNVNTNAGSCIATGVSLGTPTTSDNCTVSTVTNDAPATYPLGTTTVTWTATDNHGLSSTCTQTVTVTDNQNPTITCPANVNVNADAGSCVAAGVTLGTPTTSDNCTVASVTNDAPASFPVGTTTVTWTVTDGAGNTATCTQTVTVTDNQNPTIVCPANVSVNTNVGSCVATGVTLGTPTTSDNCTVASVTNNAPASFPLGSTTVTWTVTDGVGNTATCTQTVTVTDNQNPTIVCPANVSINTDIGSCVATGVALGTPTTADNCTVVSTTSDAPASYPVGTTTVTWTVTDGAGNTATCTQTVTVTDNQNPTITCPSNVSVNVNPGSCFATGVVLGTPTTSDNCSVASVTNDAPASFPVGTTTVTWTVTDNHGRTATCTQTVTVTDNINPTIICPVNVSTNPDIGSCMATGVSLGTPTTADNCTVASVTNNAPAAFPGGNTTVTWTVTDGAGNIATCTQTVTVTDNENPTITCPPNVNANTNAGSCVATGVALGTPAAADNCLVASVTNDAPASFPLGVTTVTWTVTDNAGNTATCTQTITITDNQNPTIVCPSNVSINTDAGSCIATGVTLGIPVTSDNCTVASVTNDAPASFPLGTTTVTWTVTDNAGNTATCLQTVTVTDNENPTIVCPSNVSVNVNPGSCFATGVVLGTPATSDNCTVVSVTNNAPASFPIGVTTVTWTVTDGAGNTATCVQTVTVTDNEDPTITCPPNVNANTNAGSCTATVFLGTPTTTDNCTVASFTNDAPASFPLGTTTVTWTVTDGAGNIATCAQTVMVTDIQPPVALCQNITVNLTSAGTVTVPASLVDNGSSDNCSIASMTLSPSTFTCANIGPNTVTLTVTDNAGNTSTCTATVTVAGTTMSITSPLITPVDCFGNTTGDIAVTITGGTVPFVFDWSNDGTGDTDDNEDLVNVAAGTYTLVVTDATSCTTTQTFTITEPAALNTSFVTTNTSCFGFSDGGSTVTVSGGTPPYDYLWSNGATTAVVSGLAAGTYSLTVTDDAGCTFTSTTTVTEPPQVIPVISGPTVVCEGQTNTLTATGGSTYVWGTGATTASINISPVVATTYTVTATLGGCTGITSHTVTVSPLPNAALSGDTLLCPGEVTPFTASGGDSYIWANGSTTPVVSVNMADEGLFYVVAFNSCGSDTAFTTIVVDSLNLSFSITDVTCFGDNDGSVAATVTWGVTPYTYSWSTGASTSVISGITAGTYSLDVTDAYGCTVTAFATVNQPPPVIAAITGTAVICEGQTITLAGSGGTTYNWSNGATGSSTTVSPSATTTYTLFVSTGPCSDTATYTVTVNPLPNATVSGDGILCPGETTILTANGGDTYVWNTGGTGQTATMDNSNAGTIFVVATNSCGADTAYMTITSDSLTGVYAGEDQNTVIGISVDLEATGGGISYTWTPADDLSCSTCANPVATPLHTTTYTVISQNANGCTDSDEVTITVDETTSVLLPDIFSPNGNGINDVLLVRGTGIRGMVFRIYDRWGQKVFESLDQAAGWDGTFNGKPLDTGVFVYTLTGTFYTGETFEKKGNITLKR